MGGEEGTNLSFNRMEAEMLFYSHLHNDHVAPTLIITVIEKNDKDREKNLADTKTQRRFLASFPDRKHMEISSRPKWKETLLLAQKFMSN